MGRTKWVRARCEIDPGAFSGERLVRLRTVEFVAPISYVLREDLARIDANDVETREGWVVGKLVGEREATYEVVMPVNHGVLLPKAEAVMMARELE